MQVSHVTRGKYVPFCLMDNTFPDRWYCFDDWWNELIVDDKKNRKKFIIERDGSITILFGNMSKDNLHFYDMREARDIETRVKRMFGSKHPFANYKKFLKGVRESYIKTFDEFNA